MAAKGLGFNRKEILLGSESTETQRKGGSCVAEQREAQQRVDVAGPTDAVQRPPPPDVPSRLHAPSAVPTSHPRARHTHEKTSRVLATEKWNPFGDPSRK